MSVRRFTAWMTIVGAIWIFALTIAVASLAVRGEDTRHALVNRTVQDDCVIQQRTLKTRWFETITRCPPAMPVPPDVIGEP